MKFIILAESAIFAYPSEGSLHYPALIQQQNLAALPPVCLLPKCNQNYLLPTE